MFPPAFFMLYLILAVCVSGCKDTVGPVTAKEEQTAEISWPEYLTLDFIQGRFNPEQAEGFVILDEKYADRPGLILRQETHDSLVRMCDDALKDGIKLVVRSATRNFDYQKNIWERKWTGVTTLSDGSKATNIKDSLDRALKILEYSAMPGASRHHWGTDIDFNNFNNSWFESGRGLAVFTWLQENAGRYGFCRPYTAKGPSRPHGYNEEKWHWSFTPLSSLYTEFAKAKLKNNHFTDFMGATTAEQLDVVKHYVLGINPDCNQTK